MSIEDGYLLGVALTRRQNVLHRLGSAHRAQQPSVAQPLDGPDPASDGEVRPLHQAQCREGPWTRAGY
jgi:hypothetical protein